MVTASTTLTLPLTLREREQYPAVLRYKATLEEYLDFAEQCQYNVQYVNGEILSIFEEEYIDGIRIMSQATIPHESLVGRIITIFNNLFDDVADLQVLGSNIKIYIAAVDNSFNADVSIVQGEPDYFRLPSGKLSTVEILNPLLLVEVLSKSTKAFDLGEKLEDYKLIPSLRQVLFVSPDKPWVSSYMRSETPGLWLNTSTHVLIESIAVLDTIVSLELIYKKFKFL